MTKIYLRSSRRWVAIAVVAALLGLAVFAVVTFVRGGAGLISVVPVLFTGVLISLVVRTAFFPFVTATAEELAWQAPLGKRKVQWKDVKTITRTQQGTVRLTLPGGREQEIAWRGLAPSDDEAFTALNRARKHS